MGRRKPITSVRAAARRWNKTRGDDPRMVETRAKTPEQLAQAAHDATVDANRERGRLKAADTRSRKSNDARVAEAEQYGKMPGYTAKRHGMATLVPLVTNAHFVPTLLDGSPSSAFYILSHRKVPKVIDNTGPLPDLTPISGHVGAASLTGSFIPGSLTVHAVVQPICLDFIYEFSALDFSDDFSVDPSMTGSYFPVVPDTDLPLVVIHLENGIVVGNLLVSEHVWFLAGTLTQAPGTLPAAGDLLWGLPTA